MIYTRRLTKLRQGAEVSRCHTIRTLRDYSVGLHSFNAMIIAKYLCSQNPEANYCKIVDYLLLHDIAEVYTGDMPANIKKKLDIKQFIDDLEHEWWLTMPEYMRPNTEDMSGLDFAICKLSDWLELLWWCVEEKRMGNTLDVPEVYTNISGYLQQSIDALTDKSVHVAGANELLSDLIDQWWTA